MMAHGSRLSAAVSRRFRALDRRLHIDHRGRSEWIWAVPIGTLMGTFGLVVAVGAFTAGVSAALYVPIGLILAVLTAGMSVAYMTPEPDSPGEDRGDGGEHKPEPGPAPRPLDWALWLPDPEREREHAGSPR